VPGRYEVSKLRYYYAIVECDTVETTRTVYTALDGLEFEKSQNIVDLRFVPDDTEFENEPREVCDEMPLEHECKLEEYQYETAALGHTKVKLSWDEDDVDNSLVAVKKKFTHQELEELDYSAYLASETDGSSDGEGADALRSIVGALQAKEEADKPEGDMEITWNVGLKEKAEAALANREDRLAERGMTIGEKRAKKVEERKKERKRLRKEQAKEEEDASDSDEELPDDPYFKHDVELEEPAPTAAKAKKKQGKAKAEAAEGQEPLDLADSEEEGGHFDMNKIAREHRMAKKNKRLKAKYQKPISEDNFKVNVDDPRFAALYSQKDYAIDPTVPAFTETREMQRLIDERQARLLTGAPADAAADAAADTTADTTAAKATSSKKAAAAGETAARPTE